MKYLIRNDIIFIPNEGLYLATSDTVEVKLSLIADRLLCLLINSKGIFISKQQIHDFLWQEYKIDASSASINNNLGILRRAFKDLGVDSLIITAPKVGVSLVQDVSIVVLEDSSPELEVGSSELEESVTFTPVPRKDKSWLIIVFFVSVGIALILFFIIFNKKTGGEYVATINSCKILSPSVLSSSEREQLIYFVSMHMKLESVVCKKNNIVIASVQKKGNNPMQNNRGFLSLCEVDGSYVYSCVNYYYLNGVK
ncbi:winged helix-turn-helix domain-containing protein [Serratia fonticola]|uniref:winged helix-turn-helix domain-containing protein n=1 Tax=Serratia fonticola TaxID=47917 RepID=UPI003AF37A88